MAATEISNDRRIQRVLPLLLKEEENKEDYIPKVVSIGPFHHGKTELGLVEAFKPKAVELFISGGQENHDFYYNKVLEMIGEIRNCYEQQSIADYSHNTVLARMMLHDACFVIIHMETSAPEPQSTTHQHPDPILLQKIQSMLKHLGMLTMAIVLRDVFLMENQIPLRLVKLLTNLRYEAGEYEKLLDRYLSLSIFGEYRQKRSSPQENRQEPLHLLEAFHRLVASDVSNAWICFKCRWLNCCKCRSRCCFRAEEEISAAPATRAGTTAGAAPATGAGTVAAAAEATGSGTAADASLPTGAGTTAGAAEATGAGTTAGAAPATRAGTVAGASPPTGAGTTAGVAPPTGAPLGTVAGSSTNCMCRWFCNFGVRKQTGVDLEIGTTTGGNQGRGQPSCLSKFLACMHRGSAKKDDAKGDLKKYVHSFRSVTDLKAKGIKFKPSSTRSLKDVKFKSMFFYAILELPNWGVSIYTKVFFLNMIAYELSPNSPSKGEVTSYISFMKSLIESPEDVKELRERKILYNMLGSDKEVLKVYKNINTYGANNPPIFHEVKERIQAHYNSKMKTWIAELIHTHFRTPWTLIAFLAATTLLALASAQLYYSVHRKSK